MTSTQMQEEELWTLVTRWEEDKVFSSPWYYSLSLILSGDVIGRMQTGDDLVVQMV